MYIILISVLIFLYALNKYKHGRRGAKLLDQIPGPRALPLLGNALDFFIDPVKLFYRGRSMANEYKRISKVWALQFMVVNLYDAKDIEVVLSNYKYINKGDIYEFLHPWLKEGLLTSSGEKWKTRRKILTPTFHFNILRQYCIVFIEQSENLIKKLQKETEKEETLILPYITDFALHAICETAMGTKLESADPIVVGNYKNAIYSLGQLLVHRFTSMWLFNPYIFSLTPTYRKQNKIIKLLHKFTADVVKERRNQKNFSNEELEVEHIDEGIGSKKRLAMLDLLFSAESKGTIDDSGIKEEVDTFMFEGHDTTTMGMTFCLMLLANNLDVQEKIFKEQNEIFGDSKETVTIEDLNKMNYLERCIKEALRLYPSVPFMNRQILEDIHLADGYTIPAGTLCNIHVFDLHRKAEYYPDPDKFDPDRFLPENCTNRHPFAYIPFSAGPRNCIGQKFALLEEKAVMSAIIRNFKLEAVTRPEDIIFSADLILRCKTPIKVRFLPRKSVDKPS